MALYILYADQTSKHEVPILSVHNIAASVKQPLVLRGLICFSLSLKKKELKDLNKNPPYSRGIFLSESGRDSNINLFRGLKKAISMAY